MADTEAIPPTHVAPPPRRAPANHTQWREGSAPPLRCPRAPPPPLPPRARSLARARPSPARRLHPPPGRLAPCVYKHKRHAEGRLPPAAAAVRLSPAHSCSQAPYSHPAPLTRIGGPAKPGLGCCGGNGQAGERPACRRLGRAGRGRGEGTPRAPAKPQRAPPRRPGRCGGGEAVAAGRVASPQLKTPACEQEACKTPLVPGPPGQLAARVGRPLRPGAAGNRRTTLSAPAAGSARGTQAPGLAGGGSWARAPGLPVLPGRGV